MASPIEGNVRGYIPRPACRAAMALRPDTPAVSSWDKPAAAKPINAAESKIKVFNIVHLPWLRALCPALSKPNLNRSEGTRPRTLHFLTQAPEAQPPEQKR